MTADPAAKRIANRLRREIGLGPVNRMRRWYGRLALMEVSSGRDHCGPVTRDAHLMPLDDPDPLAAGSDRARMTGEACATAPLTTTC